MRWIQSIMALCIVAAVAAVGYFYVDQHMQERRVKKIEITGQPTLGSKEAPVHLVLFEEPYCSACRRFALDVSPALISTFVKDGRAAITVVPVSFLPHSILLAEAWMALYHQDPSKPNTDLFFTAADYSYRHQPDPSVVLTIPQVVKMMGQASSQVNTAHLSEQLKSRAYRQQIEANTTYAKQLLGGRLATPALFINGKLVKDMSANSVMTEIHQELAHFHDGGGDR